MYLRIENNEKLKTYCPKQLIDLRFQLDDVTPTKITLFDEYIEDPTQTNLYVILSEHREIKMVPEANKISSVDFIQIAVFKLKDFLKKYNLKDNTMNETQLKEVFNYHLYPRGSKILSNKPFVNLDNVEQGGLLIGCACI